MTKSPFCSKRCTTRAGSYLRRVVAAAKQEALAKNGQQAFFSPSCVDSSTSQSGPVEGIHTGRSNNRHSCLGSDVFHASIWVPVSSTCHFVSWWWWNCSRRDSPLSEPPTKTTTIFPLNTDHRPVLRADIEGGTGSSYSHSRAYVPVKCKLLVRCILPGGPLSCLMRGFTNTNHLS
jgi:hypothetical protein